MTMLMTTTMTMESLFNILQWGGQGRIRQEVWHLCVTGDIFCSHFLHTWQPSLPPPPFLNYASVTEDIYLLSSHFTLHWFFNCQCVYYLSIRSTNSCPGSCGATGACTYDMYPNYQLHTSKMPCQKNSSTSRWATGSGTSGSATRRTSWRLRRRRTCTLQKPLRLLPSVLAALQVLERLLLLFIFGCKANMILFVVVFMCLLLVFVVAVFIFSIPFTCYFCCDSVGWNIFYWKKPFCSGPMMSPSSQWGGSSYSGEGPYGGF